MINMHKNMLNLGRFHFPQTYFRRIAQNYKTKRIPYSNNTSIQEEIILNSIKANKVPSIADWSLIKKDVLSKGKYMNEVSIDAQTISLCTKEKNYEAGKSFLQSIQSEGRDINLAALGKFMQLYYVCNENSENKNDEKFILDLFNNFKQKYPEIAAITAEYMIQAISLTKEWRQCLILLDAMKLTVRPSTSAYSVIIAAAFNNNDRDLGWNLIEEMMSLERLPMPVVYHTWLDRSINSQYNLSDAVETLLKFFAENEILPTKDVLDKCIKIIQTQKYFGRYTRLNKKGVCQCCKRSLEIVEIDESEFNELKAMFMEHVVVGKDLFTKTTPEELKAFQAFIQKAGACDIVIDGLNVAFSAGKKHPQFYAKLLANVVRHYRLKSYKVLLLGREHMDRWPKPLMDYVRANCKIFFAQNLSQDDPFVLYAAMESGLGTRFLSRDLMRGHLYQLMKPDLKRIFRKWQQLHQQSIQYVENNSGQVHITPSSPFLYATQTSKDGWHVPYADHFSNNPINPLDPPMNWLCLQRSH